MEIKGLKRTWLAVAMGSFLFLVATSPLPVHALQVFEDFTSGCSSWIPGPGWSVVNPAPGIHFYRCNYSGDSQTWKKRVPLGSAWQFQADLKFRILYANGGIAGTGSLALAQDGSYPLFRFLANITHSAAGSVLIEAQYYDGDWHEVLSSGWRAGSAPEYRVRLEQIDNSPILQLTVQSTNGFTYRAQTTPIPLNVLAGISIPGFRVCGAVVDCANVLINSPLAPSPQRNFEMLATNAVNDLLAHFWIGDIQTGHLVNTWTGYTNQPLPDPRGALWERAMLYITLENLYRLRTNATDLQRLIADWNRTRSLYSPHELEACGADSGTNWAVDDAGWSALMYLAAYRATGDPSALERAKGLVNNAFNRWLDDQLGGGMWYRDARDIKSLYQVAIVLGAFRIFKETGDQSWFDRAFACYSWMETHLQRDDSLYWVDYGPTGPIGQERPYDINEASSVVSLGLNMAMGVLHAELYHMTTNELYRIRAIRTADALSNQLLSLGGIFLNDRDAWAQGTFAGDWTRQVLSLPGIRARHWTLLRMTADSICVNARTTNGYYGGSWSGPAEGPQSRWWASGSKAEQIMTSASSVNMIVAAAFSAPQLDGLLRPNLQVTRRSSDGTPQIAVAGEPGWAHQLETATDFLEWTTVTNFFPNPDVKGFIYTPPGFSPRAYYRASLLLQ